MKKRSKKSSTIKKTRSFSLKAIIAFFRDERFKVSLGVFLLAFAIILCLSFTSYFFTWKSDQSILDVEFGKLLGKNSYQIENWIGKVGAILSNKFIHDWFGVASFSFVAIFAVFGFNLLNVKLTKTWRFLFISIILTIWSSIAFASVFSDQFFMVGGAHGYFIFNWLSGLLGTPGSYAVILLSFFVIILYSFKNSLFWIKSKLHNLRNVKKDSLEEISDDGFDKSILSETSDEAQAIGDENLEEKTPLVVFDEIEGAEQSSYEEDQILKLDAGNNIVSDKIEDEDGLDLDVNDTPDEEELTEEEIDSDMMQEFDPTKDLEFYKFPSIEILQDYPSRRADVTRDELNANKDRIVRTLRDYKIEIARITATIGPTVTLYEIVPAPGVRISKIKNLEDDIALSLAALGIRIIAPIPGKGTIGIEVPNSKPETVSMRSVLKSAKFQESLYELPVALGKTISNETYVFNLAKTPHLLVAGATGQGKSVGINAIITSLLYKKHPAHLKFVLVDPKMVELSIYNQIEKHYLAKLPNEDSCIVTDVSKVVPIMNSLCIEMDDRYALLTKARVRNIVEYNKKFVSRRLNPNNGHKYMPYIVVVIDEFADIIVQEGKQVEVPISRLAAKARAIGIHLIVATQRPSTDVITGVIKANFPTRIAFKVTNGHDSKTILDTGGANQLIGRGDMLISETGKISRVQCAFIDTPEIELLVEHIGAQQGYAEPYILPEPDIAETGGGGGSLNANEKDELFEEAARLIVRHQQGSTSLVQRKMSIGYNRAGRIIDQLEAAGIVGQYEGSKARQVLFPDEYSLEQYLNSLNENK
ncbi:MAG: DNA translocase FtsK [Bacteroidales bacterium]|nr:DNA translocase FtsK [Bacteroidales bacterium]MDD4217795.1 DNA translocase FtsK [Bacteroidales bacterium]MDY0140512.1 DNA translocase FtsK [Bacteroidales bacterium]